jgi:hypothetical protein
MAERDRLKQIHQTDLIESRINVEFVDWLKTKGPSWLLLALVGVAGWMGFYRWQQYKADHLTEAWSALMECQLPGAFEDVAARYADVYGLPQQAKRLGADTLLAAVQSGEPLGANPDSPEQLAPMTDEQRQHYLTRAERLYQEVVDTDDLSLAMTLHVVSAMQGMAVVAECRGDAAEAQRWYEAAAGRAERHYPSLAEQARKRAATADTFAADVTLPRQDQLPTRPRKEPTEPAVIDEALRDLLLPVESGEG